MNSRERVQAAMRRHDPDRVPFDFAGGFSPFQLAAFKRITGQSDPQEYFETDTRFVYAAPTRRKTDFSRYFRQLPARATVDEWGVGHLPTESDDVFHSHLDGFIYPMLEMNSVDELMKYPLPDIDASYRYEDLPDEVAAHHARGLCSVGSLECTLFEVAWYMRSMELLLVDFMENRVFANVLLDRITAKRCVQAQLMAASGIDVLRLGDDVACQRGMLMSVPTWRKWLMGRLTRVIASARSVNPDILICYHTDGNPLAIIPDLIDIGVDILNPVQPECIAPSLLKEQFGDSLSFWGCVGTQSVLPFGEPRDVRQAVRQLIDQVGDGGGLFLAPTHMVEPEVPWANVVAFVDAVKDFGACPA